MGNLMEKTHGKSEAGGPGQARWWMSDRAKWWLVDQTIPHSCADKLGGTTGEQDRQHNPGFQHGEIKPQSLLIVGSGGSD